jgi:hypothetical protein
LEQGEVTKTWDVAKDLGSASIVSKQRLAFKCLEETEEPNEAGGLDDDWYAKTFGDELAIVGDGTADLTSAEAATKQAFPLPLSSMYIAQSLQTKINLCRNS